MPVDINDNADVKARRDKEVRELVRKWRQTYQDIVEFVKSESLTDGENNNRFMESIDCVLLEHLDEATTDDILKQAGCSYSEE